MKNKRLITLLLTLVMSSASLSVGYAENADVTMDVTTEEAVVRILDTDEYKALYAMGFLGEEMADADADQYITRAQFTGYLFNLAGYALIEHKTEDIPFIDVSTETPYYNQICTMYEMGLINGTEPNMFSPNAHVTYAQACKLIVDVLGYRNYATVKYGEYPEGYVMMAGELEINDGVTDVKWSDELTAEDAMTLLYNAGCTEIMSFTGVDANGNATYETEGTDLFASNDIYYAEGIMQSNGIASIESDEAAEGMTIISDISYVSADVDLTELLGCRIKYFYRDDKVSKKLLWATEHTLFNNMIELNAIDLAVDDESYTKSNIVYYDEDSKKESIKINEYADVVYNNSFYAIPTDDLMKIKTGTMRLIDNDDDEVYDTVIIEEFYNIFVANIAPIGEYIVDKYGKTLSLTSYDYVKIIKDGKDIEFAEIGANTLISCVENKDRTKIYIYVSTESGKSNLTSIGSSRNRQVYNFESGSYRVSNEYKALIDSYKAYSETEGADAVPYALEPKPGVTYTYYLDMAGEIAEVQSLGTELQYALLMKAVPGETYEDGIVYTRLLLTDGSKISGITNKKIKINGTRMPATELFNSSRDFYSTLYGEDGKLIVQVVQVAFDDEGYLNEIQFAADCKDNVYGYDDTKFSCDYAGSTMRNSDGFWLINYKFMLDNNTVVFFKWNGSQESEPYAVTQRSSLSTVSTKMLLYDVRNDMTVPVMYVPDYFNAQAYWYSGSMMVDTSDIIFEDGQELRRVTGYLAGEYKTVTEAYPGVIPADIERGEIIKISHQNNKATKIVRQLTVDDFINNKTPRVFEGSSPDNIKATRFVPVYNVSTVGVTTINPAEWSDSYGVLNTAGFKSGTAILVTVYDTKTDEIYTGDIHDLYQVYAPYADSSLPDADDLVMVYLTTKYSAVTEAIVVLY